MDLHRILCAVDFSEDSREALEVATELARKTQAALVVLHVEDRPLWMNEPYMHLPGDVRENAFARNEAQLAQWAQQARQRDVAEVTTSLLSGVVWQQIVSAAAEDPRVDMIVVGSHGRTGLRRALMGSVAERVVRHAPCSVLVARSTPRNAS